MILMATTSPVSVGCHETPPHCHASSPWLVCRTHPRHEHRAHAALTARGAEAWVPTHWVTREWSDRRRRLEVPLLPGYCFVALDQRLALQQVDSFAEPRGVFGGDSGGLAVVDPFGQRAAPFGVGEFAAHGVKLALGPDQGGLEFTEGDLELDQGGAEPGGLLARAAGRRRAGRGGP